MQFTLYFLTLVDNLFLGVFSNLLQLRIEAGDKELKDHLEKGQKNATYLSPRIQNELISLCGESIKTIVSDDAKKAVAYSILSDETADVGGKEQMSMGVRFFDEKKEIVREDFLGYVQLEAMDANTISRAIAQFIENCGLDPVKCVGQGYDGCSTMAGVRAGVQTILQNKFPKGLYFHCASHKLNLIINAVNIIPVVRNTITTVKAIIKFFRESPLRRKYVPNIPAFCETRWSQKYRSIAVFKSHYQQIVNGLDILSKEGNSSTRKSAFPLHSAAR